jgi:hypothetical protein
MALTITRVPDGNDVWGRTKIEYRDLTLDDAYAASTGYVINAQDVGLRQVFGAAVVGGNQAAGKLSFIFDFNASAGDLRTAVRLRAFFPTGGATSAPSALANPIVTSGASTASAVDATTPNITPGVAKEVADGGDLGTIVLRVRFEGR